MNRLEDRLKEWLGQEVVIDCVSPYVAIGRLAAANDAYLELHDADMHDLRDSTTNRELYLVETVRVGVRVNRKALVFRMAEVVGISQLADVVA